MTSAALKHPSGPLDDNHGADMSDENIVSPRSSSRTVAGCPPRPLSSGLRKAAGLSESSHLDSDERSSEQHLCQKCGKRYKLLCQLNKHTKSHSRPHKCPDHDCKYYSMGWPTLKELERHINDKHSDAPETYPCLYNGCPYKSKRDSNRKQHMEKVHGWVYNRSKSNGRRMTSPTDIPSMLSMPSLGPMNAPTATHGAPARRETPPAHQGDWILYDNEPDQSSMPFSASHSIDGELLEFEAPNSQDPNVVVLWTSPGTRLERRKTDLENFTQKFHHDSAAGDGVPIDPQLLPSELDTRRCRLADNARNGESSLVVNSAAVSSRHSPSSSSPDVSTAVRSSAGGAPSRTARQRPGDSETPRQHGMGPLNIPLVAGAPGPPSHQPIPPKHPVHKRDEDDEDQDKDDEHQKKRLKTSPTLNFEENRMLDIFHARYPHVYHRDKKAIYSSCHTVHQDISTLVRHLSRAPHRLKAVERYISSFDVPAQDGVAYAHTRVGVCRRCWHVLYSRAEFEDHIARDCEKVSKGKQEKWNILFQAFTPYVTDAMSSGLADVTPTANTALSLAHPQVPRQPSVGSTFGPICVTNDDAPHDPLSPSTVELGFAERREPGSPRLTEVQQLRAALSYLLSPLLEDGDDSPDAEKLRQFQEYKDRATLIQGVLTREQQQDHHQLLRGLKLQQNELPEGLMDEIDSQQNVINSQQPLSRTSSALSSDRITHVPTTPPQQYGGLMGVGHDHLSPGQLLHHLPPSIPDSGYGSANKISVTESEAARLKAAHPGYTHLAPQQQNGNQLEVGRPDIRFQPQQQQGMGHPLVEGPPDPPSFSAFSEELDVLQLLTHEEGLQVIQETRFSQSSEE